MNKSTKIVMAIMALPSFSGCIAQFKNTKTESVKIYGNCTFCENTIEKAGNLKKMAQVDWNKDTKMATLTYDPYKTDQQEILKRIALAGYDSDEFLAPDDAYSNLPDCCRYARAKKSDLVKSAVITDVPAHKHNTIAMKTTELGQEENQLKAVFDNYFALKEALVKSDGDLASTRAKELLNTFNKVMMNKLADKEHLVWMKVMTGLKIDIQQIEETKDVGQQRDHLNSLSATMYELLKVSPQEKPTYYQHCPMANEGKGAHWLSRENAVKNPYYGSKMLTCGKTVETIE